MMSSSPNQAQGERLSEQQQRSKGRPRRRYAPVPVDFILLDLLPDKGIVGGVHWRGIKVADLRINLKEEHDIELHGEGVSARLRTLEHHGFVTQFPGGGAGGSRIWARTPQGAELLSKRDEILGL
jgi:hypothetical protein